MPQCSLQHYLQELPPTYPPADEWIETLWYIYKGILLSHKKECIWVRSNEVDEPRAYDTEWSKSEREKQISYINAYIWNLERWYRWTYLQGCSGDADTENRHMDTEGRGAEEREGRMNGDSHMETYTTILKIDSQWEFAVWLSKLIPGLCNNIEGGMGWDGVGGRFQREGIYV